MDRPKHNYTEMKVRNIFTHQRSTLSYKDSGSSSSRDVGFAGSCLHRVH